MPSTVVVLLGMAILSAAGIGLLAGEDVVTTIAVLVAVAAGVMILLRPMVGLAMLLTVISVENLAMVTTEFTATRAIGLVVFGAWFLRKIALRQSWRAVVTSGVFVPGLGLCALILLSTLWAENPFVVRGGFTRLAQMIVLLSIIIDLARSWERLDSLAKALVIGATIAAALTIFQGVVLGYRRAGHDIGGDVNSTATIFMTVIPLGFYLMRSKQPMLWRLLGLVYVVAAAVAVNLTLSRFNLLLLPVVLLIMVLLTWRDRVNRGLLITLIGVGIAGFMWAVPIDKVIERSRTIAPYIAQTLGRDPAAVVTSGRGYHLKVGLEIAKDNPVLGVGYNNYGVLFYEEYQYSVPGRNRLYYGSRSAHSSYIGMLADLGLVGLSLWLAILFVPLRSIVIAWRANRSRPPTNPAVLAQGLAVALSLHILAYALYMPNQNEKILWVIIAMCVAAGRLAVGSALNGQRPAGNATASSLAGNAPRATMLPS